MSDTDKAAADPVSAILKSKGTVIRGVAFLAGVAGLLLPAVTSSGMGMSQSGNIAQMAGWAMLVPLAIGAALIVPGVAASYSRLADIIAAAITTIVLAYAVYALFDAMGQISQVTGMMGSSAGAFGVGIAPNIGLFAMAAAAALMVFQVVRGRS